MPRITRWDINGTEIGVDDPDQQFYEKIIGRRRPRPAASRSAKPVLEPVETGYTIAIASRR